MIAENLVTTGGRYENLFLLEESILINHFDVRDHALNT
jgi:hypothetical protein